MTAKHAKHEHSDSCEVLELFGGRLVCLTEEPGLRAQIMELMPEPGDEIAITYKGDNADGSKRFAVKVWRQ